MRKILKILSKFVYLLITFICFNCSGGDTGPSNAPIYGVFIYTYPNTRLYYGDNFSITVRWGLSTQEDLSLVITTQLDDNTQCVVYTTTIGTNGSLSNEISVSINTLNFINSCNLASFDGRNYKITVDAPSNNYSDFCPLTLGIVNFNVTCFYSLPQNPQDPSLTPIPNGWNPLISAYSSCLTTLVTHGINDGYQPPWDIIINEDHIFNYVYTNLNQHGFNSNNYNTAILLGLCRVDNMPNRYGYSGIYRITNDHPGVACIFVWNINTYLTSWPSSDREKLKTIISAHELGHIRGITGEELPPNYTYTHTSDQGTNWNKCCMESPIPDDDNHLNNQVYCAHHAKMLRVISW